MHLLNFDTGGGWCHHKMAVPGGEANQKLATGGEQQLSDSKVLQKSNNKHLMFQAETPKGCFLICTAKWNPCWKNA